MLVKSWLASLFLDKEKYEWLTRQHLQASGWRELGAPACASSSIGEKGIIFALGILSTASKIAGRRGIS
jgi:hypothetical protein